MKTREEILKIAEDIQTNYVEKLQDRIGVMRRNNWSEALIQADQYSLNKYASQVEILKHILEL